VHSQAVNAEVGLSARISILNMPTPQTMLAITTHGLMIVLEGMGPRLIGLDSR
jgi:hypothetical protein